MKQQTDKKLNIAMLGHKRIPSREGGVEIVVEELATRMAAAGHSVAAYNRSGHHVSGAEFDAEKKDSYKGVKLKYVATLNKRGLAAMTSSVTASIRAAFGKYDVVHYHAEGPSFMCWLPKLFGKRIVVTVHGLDHQRAKWGKLASTYIMWGEKNAVRFADEIIVLSKAVQDYFTETYGRKTVYIPNGVSKPQVREASEITEKWGLTKDSYILYLGRIVPEKGLRYLVEAYKALDTDKKLVIAGGASGTEEFMETLKDLAGDDKRIIFTGFVQGRPLEELYSNAYVYTLPSDLEGMPLSLLEAMSYGNACLTSDIAECTEVTGENAVYFEKSNATKLGEALQDLINNPEKVAQLKENAAEYILQRYNWDDVTEKTMKLYER